MKLVLLHAVQVLESHGKLATKGRGNGKPPEMFCTDHGLSSEVCSSSSSSSC